MKSAKLDGDRLRALREDRELTTTELAARLGEDLGRKVSQSTVTKYEMGHRQPLPRMFGALCRSLNCAKEELLVQPDDNEQQPEPVAQDA